MDCWEGGLGVEGSGTRIRDEDSRVPDSGTRIRDEGSRVPDSGTRIHGVESTLLVNGMRDSGKGLQVVEPLGLDTL